MERSAREMGDLIMKESSSIKTIYAPIERVYATLSDLENLRPLLEKAQSDENLQAQAASAGYSEMLGNIKNVVLSSDTIEALFPMVGTVSLRIVEREELKCVKLETEKSPIKATIWVQMLPENADVTKIKLTASADIPFMLRPMIGSRMKDGVEKIADLVAQIRY